MNTRDKGQIRFIIFKKSKRSRLYTGVCLDFGIVIQDKDIECVKSELERAALGYLKTVRKKGLDNDLLNNQAEKEYWEIYHQALESEVQSLKSKRKITNPFGVFVSISSDVESLDRIARHARCHA